VRKLTLEAIDIEDGVLPREVLVFQRPLDQAPLSVVRCDDGEFQVLIVRLDEVYDSATLAFVLVRQGFSN
jgi:hypothetical protein